MTSTLSSSLHWPMSSPKLPSIGFQGRNTGVNSPHFPAFLGQNLAFSAPKSPFSGQKSACLEPISWISEDQLSPDIPVQAFRLIQQDARRSHGPSLRELVHHGPQYVRDMGPLGYLMALSGGMGQAIIEGAHALFSRAAWRQHLLPGTVLAELDDSRGVIAPKRLCVLLDGSAQRKDGSFKDGTAYEVEVEWLGWRNQELTHLSDDDYGDGHPVLDLGKTRALFDHRFAVLSRDTVWAFAYNQYFEGLNDETLNLICTRYQFNRNAFDEVRTQGKAIAPEQTP